MIALRVFRYFLWAGVCILGLILIFNAFSPPPQKSPTQIMAKAAPILPSLDYAQQPWNVVNFFASWCVPCRAEHPLLTQLAADTHLVGIAWKDRFKDNQSFLNELGNPFHKVYQDPEGYLGQEWLIQGLPATFLIDQHGKIRYQRRGILLKEHQQIILDLIKN